MSKSHRRQAARRRQRRKQRKIAAGMGLGIGAALGTGATAHAQDFTVTNLNDAGSGSLRQAVIDANGASGADRVLFQSSLTGTLDLTSGQLLVTGPTEFIGPGANRLTITENQPQGIFYLQPVASGTQVKMSALKLSGANASNGSAITSRDTDLTLANMNISGNTATGSAGAVYSFGTGSWLKISGSTLDGNDGGINGGAIVANYTATYISNSSISNNRVTGTGGAVYSIGPGGGLHLDTVTMAGNHGATNGGALTLKKAYTNIRRSTISGNQASGTGGAIYAFGLGGQLILDTSTISGNGNPSSGGAITIGGVSSTLILSSTIADNSATDRGGGIYAFSNPYTIGVDLFNTLVGDNTAPTGPDLETGVGATFFANTSLIENPGTTGIHSSQSVEPRGPTPAPPGPNITGQDPKLGPLADNGGPTLTQALLPGSPALDAGILTIVGGSPSGVDQRGAPRPFDLPGIASPPRVGPTDIGAYEEVLCAGRVVNRVGTEGNDLLTGTSGPDGILGLGGKDKISGLVGNDGLCGGPGKDKLKGGKGNDRLLGQAGKDVLIGGKGKDTLKGGPGKDKRKQ
jgi:hypothetical protein